MKSDKHTDKSKKDARKGQKPESGSCCCYVVDPCGCYVDPCGCYVSSCCC